MPSRTLDPCSIIRVQSWDAEASPPSPLHQITETTWPRKVGTVTSGLVDILCIGPTDWLVMADTLATSDLCTNLNTAMTGSSFRATDVSHALTRIEIEDLEIRPLLLKGCSLDLHPTRFPPGQCARTRFAGVPTILRCWTSTIFGATVTSSYREYVLAWLADAAA